MRYDAAVRVAAAQVWEASGRPSGRLASKNLVEYLPTLVGQLERHGELRREPAVRADLLRLSAATLDRLLRDQAPIRTFSEWRGVTPGSLQADRVLWCGTTTQGHI